MLISVDASQLEWRCATELSQDAVALQEILDGADTHSLNQVAFGLPSRLVAKVYLFRTIFRGSGWGFANDPDFSHVSSDPSYWEDINEKFYKKYHGLDKKHKEWAREVTNNRPIVGPLGREWPIKMKRDRRGELQLPWKKLTNYPVQGTGADVMMIARLSFMRRMKRLTSAHLCQLVSSVHDSIVVDVSPSLVLEIINMSHQVFDDIPKNIKKLFGYEWKVPLACEVKAGMVMKDRWKKLPDGTKVEVCPTGMEEVKRSDIT